MTESEPVLKKVTVKNGKIVPDINPQKTRRDIEKEIQFEAYFNTEIAPAMYTKIQAWINDQGSRSTSLAGGGIEWAGHSGLEDSAENNLVASLRSTRGHFSSDLVWR